MVAPVVTRTRHPLELRLQCRKEWTHGQGTLGEIARKHGVSKYTVTAWYRREGWSAARKRWFAKQLSDNDAPAKPPCYTPNPKNTTNAHTENLQRLEMQLNALDNLIENALSSGKANELQKLSAARQHLFGQWRILAGIPLPGSRRPAKERPQSPNQELPLPLELPPYYTDEEKPALNPAA